VKDRHSLERHPAATRIVFVSRLVLDHHAERLSAEGFFTNFSRYFQKMKREPQMRYRRARHLAMYAREHMKALLGLFDFRLRDHQLAGPLSGCWMRGKVYDAYLDGSYEPEVCQTIMRIVQQGWICVDVGAHIGYFTLLLAKLVGERGRVIAFEPHPENARRLRFNARINGFETRVQVEDVAISDGISQSVNLFPGRGHSPAEWNIVGHDVEGNPRQPELEVQASSLDAYFTACPCVDFVKIDIEGAEAQALRGMRRLLRECSPFVLVEFHDEKGWTGRRELLAANYWLYDVRNARWLNSELDVGRVYHCLAVPRERLADVRSRGL